jgi:hypothetical protein
VADFSQEVLDALVRLMNDEIKMSELKDEVIVKNMRIGRGGRKLVGEGAAELHRRGWTWPRIAHEFGVDQSTAHRWAQPYLREGDPS